MVASGVKGIAITPTSAAVSAALKKAVKSGVKVVLMDNDMPTWKQKTSVVATNNLKGGVLAGQWLAGKLKAGDTLGILEGCPAIPALDDRVKGMLTGLGTMKSSIKVVSKLETDCDQTKGATAAQTILTANPKLTAIYSACGPPALGRDPVDQERGHQARRDHSRRLRRLDRRAQSREGGDRERRAVRSFRRRSATLGITTLYAATQGKKVAKNVDTGTGDRLRLAPPKAPRRPRRGAASTRDHRFPPSLLEPRTHPAAVDDGGAQVIDRSFEPRDLEPLLASAASLRRCSSRAAASDPDTDSMFDLVEDAEWVGAVTAWCRLDDVGVARRRLDEPGSGRSCAESAISSIRSPTRTGSCAATSARALALLEERGLLLELPGVFPGHLGDVPELAATLPRADHRGRPPRQTADRDRRNGDLASDAPDVPPRWRTSSRSVRAEHDGSATRLGCIRSYEPVAGVRRVRAAVASCSAAIGQSRS